MSTSAIASAAQAPAKQAAASHRAAAQTSRNLAVDYLRGWVIVLVLAYHTVLAYDPRLPAADAKTSEPARLAAPILDTQRWAGFSLFAGFHDIFFMSLLFFLSGLFVWSSIQRKGSAVFVRGRMLRLGLPFAIAAGVLAPATYYSTFLETRDAANFGAFIWARLSHGVWLAGPVWFIWVLLVFDCVSATLFVRRPGWVDALAKASAGARLRPARFIFWLVAVSASVYIPMEIFFGSEGWTALGPFQFQTSRIFHYAVYFIAGMGVGAYGMERGLLAPDGMLARHWRRWLCAMPIAFALMMVFIISIPALARALPQPSITLPAIGGVGFALSCAVSSFGYLALFLRFAKTRIGAFDSLSDNQYGMYLIHYFILAWLQFPLLSAPLPAIAKASIVFTGVLALSWSITAALRRIPAVARVI